MQRQKRNKCENCDACKQMYYRIWYRHRRLCRTYCTLHNKPTEHDRTCDEWRKKLPRKYDLSPQRFDEAERDIAILQELLPDQ